MSPQSVCRCQRSCRSRPASCLVVSQLRRRSTFLSLEQVARAVLPRKDINKVTLVAIQAHGDTEIGLSMSVDGWTSGTRLRNRGALRCCAVASQSWKPTVTAPGQGASRDEGSSVPIHGPQDFRQALGSVVAAKGPRVSGCRWTAVSGVVQQNQQKSRNFALC